MINRKALTNVLAGLLLVAGLGLSETSHAAGSKTAVTLVQQATVAYRAGRYAAAAELFVAAFELSNAPIQLRNAAKAYMKDERWPEAEAAWKRYRKQAGLTSAARSEAAAELRSIKERQSALQAKAEAADARGQAVRAQAETERAQVETERAQVAAERAQADAAEAKRQARQANVNAVRAPPTQAPTPVSPVPGYVLGGIGVAAVVASGALFLHAGSRLSSLDTALETKDAAGKIIGISGAEAQSELSGINSQRNVSVALLGLGVAAGVGGAILWSLAAGAEDDVQASVIKTAGGGFGLISLSF